MLGGGDDQNGTQLSIELKMGQGQNRLANKEYDLALSRSM